MIRSFQIRLLFQILFFGRLRLHFFQLHATGFRHRTCGPVVGGVKWCQVVSQASLGSSRSFRGTSLGSANLGAVESRTKVLPRSDQHHDAHKMLGRCEIVLLKPVNRKRNKLCENTLMLFHTMGLSSDLSTRKASRHSSVFDILSCLRCF